MKPTSTLLAFIFLFICSANVFASAKQVITIAKPEQAYPPYHYLENGKVAGLVPDIIEATAKAIGNIEIDYQVMPWKRMFELAKQGEIDAIMPINLNTERQTYLNFVELPVIYERMNFVSTTAFDIEFDGDLSKLTEYEVAGIAGYYYGEAYSAENFNTIELPNEETQVKMLLAGRFPLALMDANIIPYYINYLGGEKEFKIKVLEPHLYRAGLHLAFAKQGNFPTLNEQFNRALITLKDSDAYQRILNTHLTTH